MAKSLEYFMKTISYKGEKYNYYLKISKARKLIGLRVKNGDIYISAPDYAQDWQIEQLIYKHMPKIIKMKNNVEQTIKYHFDGENSWVKIFDEKKPIKIVDDNIHAVLKPGGMYMKKYPTKIEQTKKMYTFLSRIYYMWFKKEVDAWAFKMGLNYKNLSIKYMETRWGVCYPQSSKISLNPALLHFPKEVIYYVIVHELSHLQFPNHSADFKHNIEKYLPNYRDLEKVLKQRGL